MGIADGSHGEPVDCSVGTIVWVRRRNGSWWPGKILGPNELSSSHLMSPRSGTPVKLLGRDDASVDWYNLEKSRRVKAFRCGEFDDCIEKAESSQCIPIKKREKYARREDAILHALELEKLHLEHKWDKLGTTANFTSEKTSFLSRKQFASDNSKSQSLPKRPDSTVEENIMGSLLYIQKTKQANKPDWEDDNFESVPRMRGLQDFGLKTAPSKRKLAPSIACDSSQKSVLPENHVNCSKISMPIKRKQLQGGLLEESLVKRRDRRRPLVQVLQSSAKLPECRALQTDGDVSISYALPNDCLAMRMPQCQFGIVNHVLHPGSSTEDIACTDLIEDENDFSEGDFLNPDSEEERAILSGSRNSGSYMGGNGLIFQAQQQAANMDSKELNEHGISSYPSQLYPHDQNADISADMGVSKWQLKRKRNIRNLTKRPVELMDRNKCNGSMLEASFNAKGNAAKMRIGISIQQPLHQVFHHRSVRELNYACRRDEDDITSSDNDSQAMSLSETDQFSNLPSSPNSEGCLFSQSSLRRYWEDSDQDVDPLRFYPSGYREADGGDLMESMLIDVNLKVQASYQGERVPLVSLMSRLNGKAIIGHPVQIEVLDEGSTDLLISESNCHGSPADRNGSPGLPPAWCTARRTAMQRVPRPRLSEDEEWGPNQHHVENNQNLLKKMRANRFKHKMRLVRKSSHILRPLMNKLSRKIVKKTNLPNQKTRTLSSFAVEQKFSGKIGNSDGLVKPEKTIPITCVPVKLIFSRILEAVGR